MVRIAAQLPMPNMGIPGTQSNMLAEWGTAPGSGGHKEPLIKVDTRPVDKRQIELESEVNNGRK